MSGEQRCCFDRSQVSGHIGWCGGCDRRCGSWFVLLTSSLPARRRSGLLDLVSKQRFSQHILRSTLKSFLPIQLKNIYVSNINFNILEQITCICEGLRLFFNLSINFFLLCLILCISSPTCFDLTCFNLRGFFDDGFFVT